MGRLVARGRDNARALNVPERLAWLRQTFGSAADAAPQEVSVVVHSSGVSRHTLVFEFAAPTHAAAAACAARLRVRFGSWQEQPLPIMGTLAERLGVTGSDDLPPRVAALPEFWYAKVMWCVRCRPGAAAVHIDLLLVAWLTDQGWLDDVPRAPESSGPNATLYQHPRFPAQLPAGSAMRVLAGGPHLDLVPVSAEAARAMGGVWAALAGIALHHRVHMVPPFERWAARPNQAPGVFKLNTHAWL